MTSPQQTIIIKDMFSPWSFVKDGDPRATALYLRHYSCRHYQDGRPHKRFVGPGQRLVLLTPACDALLVWRKFIDKSGQQGINCAVFRNESPQLSSFLINQAELLARHRWPGERLYTYINPRKIRSSNPGFCFLKAGWQKAGYTKGGLLILEKKGGETDEATYSLPRLPSDL